MKELEIYKFVTENDIECKWYKCYDPVEDIDEEYLVIWIPPEHIKHFCKLLGEGAFYHGHLCEIDLSYTNGNCKIGIINLNEVLKCYNIDAKKVFPKDKFK